MLHECQHSESGACERCQRIPQARHNQRMRNLYAEQRWYNEQRGGHKARSLRKVAKWSQKITWDITARNKEIV
jgi:hypothetical protein